MDIPETIEDFRLAIEAEQETRVALMQERRDNLMHFRETGEHTPRAVRDLLDEKIRLCGIRIDAMTRGLSALQTKYNGDDQRWAYSDMLLAELTLVCEREGQRKLVKTARALLALRLNQKTGPIDFSKNPA